MVSKSIKNRPFRGARALARFNPNSEVGRRVAATPRRSKVQATPRRQLPGRKNLAGKKCDEGVAATLGRPTSEFGFNMAFDGAA